MGYVYNGKPVYLHKPMAKQGLQSEFDVKNLTSLPKVGIVYGYANCSPLPIQAFVNAKFDGIVLAGVGDGNFYKDVFDVALKAQNSVYRLFGQVVYPLVLLISTVKWMMRSIIL